MLDGFDTSRTSCAINTPGAHNTHHVIRMHSFLATHSHAELVSLEPRDCVIRVSTDATIRDWNAPIPRLYLRCTNMAVTSRGVSFLPLPCKNIRVRLDGFGMS